MDLFDDKDIVPMLLGKKEKAFNDDNYLFELKFDGTRALIYIDKDYVLIKNRKGNILNNQFPEIIEMAKIIKTKCIMDGEIVAIVDDKPSFSALQARFSLKSSSKIKQKTLEVPTTFVLFDLLYYKRDITNKPLLLRKKIIDKHFNKQTGLGISKYFIGTGKPLYKFTKDNDLEGIVAKKIDSTYQINQRSKDWLKIKNKNDSEFYIGGYIERNTNVASLLLGELKGSKLEYVSNVTIGKKRFDYEKIKALKAIKSSPFNDYHDADAIYIDPIYQCTVSYLERTKSGGLRQPVYKSLRLD